MPRKLSYQKRENILQEYYVKRGLKAQTFVGHKERALITAETVRRIFPQAIYFSRICNTCSPSSPREGDGKEKKRKKVCTWIL
jgi:hypothetical protein